MTAIPPGTNSPWLGLASSIPEWKRTLVCILIDAGVVMAVQLSIVGLSICLAVSIALGLLLGTVNGFEDAREIDGLVKRALALPAIERARRGETEDRT
jgi:hypothetical protein